jgi:four helix bundle protein
MSDASGQPTAQRTFEDLLVWQSCRELRRFSSRLARKLPGDEKYRLTDQLIRSSRATTALIAEGYGRFHFKENIQYCRQSRGELYEVLDHLIVARDEEFISDSDYTEARRLAFRSIELINGYIRFLQRQEASQPGVATRRRNGTPELAATRDKGLQ